MAFGSFEPGGPAQPMADINTTPLVDVMLVLLIIFIVCTPLMTHSIKVDLPKTEGTAAPAKAESILLAIDAEGKVSWDGIALEDAALAQKLAELAARQPPPELRLLGDKAVRYERVAQVMAMVRKAGLAKLSFVMLAGVSP